MAVIFLEGFDKYGAVGSVAANVEANLTAEWTTATNTITTVAGLSSTGSAVLLGSSGTLTKTLASNYSRLIGGLRFSDTLVAQAVLMQFRDGSTAQCSITLETTGVIELRTGGSAGTALATGGSVSANSTHFLEWDITFGSSSSYQVWLDGVSLFSGTGNTRGGTSNNYANAIALVNGAGSCTIDDLYLFDSTRC